MHGREAALIRNGPLRRAFSYLDHLKDHTMNLTANNPAHECASSKASSVTIVDYLPALNDRYADAIMRGNEHLYDAIEVQGVRDLLAGTGVSDTQFEVDNVDPQSFSVYVHIKDDGADAVGDFSTYQLAANYARELSAQYGLRVFDYVPEVHKGRKAMQ